MRSFIVLIGLLFTGASRADTFSLADRNEDPLLHLPVADASILALGIVLMQRLDVGAQVAEPGEGKCVRQREDDVGSGDFRPRPLRRVAPELHADPDGDQVSRGSVPAHDSVAARLSS